MKKFLTICTASLLYFSAQAQDSTPKKVDTAKTVAVAAPVSPLSMPSMAGPLTINPEPYHVHQGFLKDVYVSGVASGLFLGQNNVSPGDRKAQTDVSNAQIFIQKADGIFQFFLQVGAYSVPDLGLSYMRSTQAVSAWGLLPQAYIKLQPTKSFSVEVGKLPTLIGAEYTFSFENMNIERGLLWNQENAVNRGIQFNYAIGKVSLSAAYSDGFYSNKYNWLMGSLTYAINGTNTLAAVAGGNLGATSADKTPGAQYQNNGSMYNLLYTHVSGNWTIEPYLQYTMVPLSSALGLTQKGSTFGGALFINYNLPSTKDVGVWIFPLRLEYIASKGTGAGAPNLMYGAGSKGFSGTITPGYQYKRIFARAELSYVSASGTTPGSALGPLGNSTSQSRALLEIGMLF